MRGAAGKKSRCSEVENDGAPEKKLGSPSKNLLSLIHTSPFRPPALQADILTTSRSLLYSSALPFGQG